jgi:hypothetical protein
MCLLISAAFIFTFNARGQLRVTIQNCGHAEDGMSI